MATITEDYVSFEVAKLLKEKGFDERCTHYYKNEKYLVDLGYTNINSYTNSDLVEEFAAPTLQMAMKWFREIHKLDIDVSIEYKNSKKVYYYSILKKTVIRNIDCLHSETNFDSYEEACEAAIKYCLENLI